MDARLTCSDSLLHYTWCNHSDKLLVYRRKRMQVDRCCCTRVIWSVGSLGWVISVMLHSTVSLSYIHGYSVYIHTHPLVDPRTKLRCMIQQPDFCYIGFEDKTRVLGLLAVLIWLDAARIRWGCRTVPYLLQVSEWHFSSTAHRFFLQGPSNFYHTLKLHLTPVSMLYSQKL